jgi:hypothetical protein
MVVLGWLGVTWLATWAMAEPGAAPVASDRADGSVVVVAVVEAPQPDVQRLLADASEVRRLFPDVLDEQIERDGDGPCMRVHRRTRGLLRPFELFTRRCPTAAGFREELVSSSDFGAYASEWVVTSDPAGGTRIEYRVRTELEVAVPESAVRAALRKAAVRAVSSLIARIGGR